MHVTLSGLGISVPPSAAAVVALCAVGRGRKRREIGVSIWEEKKKQQEGRRQRRQEEGDPTIITTTSCFEKMGGGSCEKKREREKTFQREAIGKKRKEEKDNKSLSLSMYIIFAPF